MAEERKPLLSDLSSASSSYSAIHPQTKKSDVTDEGNVQFQTRKSLKTISAVFVQAGVMIGSGIFITSNEVMESVNGSVGISLMAWLTGGILAMLSTLCYCELATSIPESGSDYAYLNYAYGPPVAFLVPWMETFLPTSDALLSLTFATYAIQPFFKDCEPPSVAVKLAAMCMLLLFTAINSRSVKAAVRLQVLFAACKIIAVLVIVISAIIYCSKDSTTAVQNFNDSFNTDVINGITFTKLTNVFFQATWPYTGWNSLNHVTEEIEESAKTLPRASVGSVLVVIIVYLMVNVAYLMVLSPAEIMNSSVIVATFSNKAMEKVFWFTSLIICLSAIGSYNGSVMTDGRLSYVAARKGHLPQIFGMLHIDYYTPAAALFLNNIGAIVLIAIGDIGDLLKAYGFVSWVFFALSSFAVLILRKRRPDLHRPYKVPTVIPVTVTIIGTGFIILSIVNNPTLLYFIALGYYVVGLGVYYLFVHKNYQVPGMNTITLFCQKLLKLAPEEWKPCID